MQFLNSELATSNQLVKECLKDKEKLLCEIEILTKKLVDSGETERLVKQELSASKLKVDELIQEKQSLLDQLRKSFVEKAKLEEISCDENMRTTTVEKIVSDKEVERLKEELAQKQKEITSLLLKEANTNVLVSEAQQKIDLCNELEEHWRNKELAMSEVIDDLNTQLEQAKARTQNEEIDSLRKELAFSHSIIADQKRKEIELQQKIDSLISLPAGLVTGTAPREKKPRKYCDICEVFDQHESEDCPNQEVYDVSNPHKFRKHPIEEREYCDHCEGDTFFISVFGHDTFACVAQEHQNKNDSTF
ncbi:hypothetical protein DICVIV_12629 [Dictyocaulus viviparus]|uniref:CLIP1 zinc knuckle domain-containing protein n=1 Tax=Dictyocaulus viviparus TaxID=29172 RepID=A0A0D8XA01_DICVI|nr:hypothetical protein DICVIV_12629 [Dictyocaulus viviparus]